MADTAQSLITEIDKNVVPIGDHKYQAVLPGPLWAELQALARRQHTSVGDLIRRFVEMGLITVAHQESGGTIVFKSPGEPDTHVRFL